MTVYVFGNPDIPSDSAAFQVAEELKGEKGIDFVFADPNADLPFAGARRVVLLDCVSGLKKVTLIDETQLDKLVVTRTATAHDYDLGFQLKYLTKLKKLHRIFIIGLPQFGEIDYRRVQSILRKLVEQEMHGS